MDILFNALLDKKIESDDDVKALFPPKSGVNVTSLKNKLKERLLHALFLLDFKEANFSSRQKPFSNVIKNGRQLWPWWSEMPKL